MVTQPRSQDLYPGLGVSQGKGPGNEVEGNLLCYQNDKNVFTNDWAVF